MIASRWRKGFREVAGSECPATVVRGSGPVLAGSLCHTSVLMRPQQGRERKRGSSVWFTRCALKDKILIIETEVRIGWKKDKIIFTIMKLVKRVKTMIVT